MEVSWRIGDGQIHLYPVKLTNTDDRLAGQNSYAAKSQRQIDFNG